MTKSLFNRWDDGSDTPWSRSRSGSREHSSDQTSDYSAQHRRHRKEKKKAKRKKKAKKRKHSKKHKKNIFREPSLLEGERSASSSRRSRNSRYHERSHSRSRSPSTSHHSRRTYGSGSNRRHSSSRSSRGSRSYSRSRGRSYSRSRSRSDRRFRSSSRSRSRSRSITRTHSHSGSRYGTRSRTRSRSMYRSPSSHYKNRSISPKRAKQNESTTQKINNPLPTTTQATEPKAPPASTLEGVPVLPLSDSPPPSRWKPGQKPWKPSYVRIQEIKTKTDSTSHDLLNRTPGADLAREPASSLQTQLQNPRDPNSIRQHRANRMQHGDLLQRGSSRSPSSSQSRSRSRSRYRSMSPGQYQNRSSTSPTSSSRSDSYDSYSRKSSEKWRKHHKSHRRSQKRTRNSKSSHAKEISSPYTDKETDSTHSPIHQRNTTEAKENALGPVSDLGYKTESAKNPKSENKASHKVLMNCKMGSGWESDGDNLNKVGTGVELNTTQIHPKEEDGLSEVQKKEILTRCWESESDSEMPVSNTKAGETKHTRSDKEEGEASSESESEEHAALNKSNQVSRVSGELKSTEEHSEEYTKAEKHKSKKAKRKHKHKRKNSDRSGSHRFKTKSKKSKKKHQKPKETFHWQPPLEFGDEVEEDDSRSQVKQTDSTVKKESSNSVTQEKSLDLENKDHEKVSLDSSKDISSDSGNMTKNQRLRLNIQVAKKSAQSDHFQISSGQSNTNVQHVQHQPKDKEKSEILTPETSTEKEVVDLPSLSAISKNDNPPHTDQKASVTAPSAVPLSNPAGDTEEPGSTGLPVDTKWKPLKGMTAIQTVSAAPLVMKFNRPQELADGKTQGLKIEIKNKSRVRPGSLFDEVRKTARLNQRPRNQDSSSEEDTPTAKGEPAASHKHSRSKSRSVSSPRSRRRGRSHSYTCSRSRSRSSSYSSRYMSKACVRWIPQ